MARLLNWLKSIGVGVYVALAFIFAVIIGGLRLFYGGKEVGEIEANAEKDKERVREAAARGDDDEVQRLWRKSMGE